MSVNHQKKFDAQKALCKTSAYPEKMMIHHNAKETMTKDKGNGHCHFSHEKRVGFKRKPELSKLRDSSKSCGDSNFLKGY